MINLEELNRKRDEIIAIAKKYGVKNIRVFGSVARGESDESSDIDLLATLERGVTLMKLAGLMSDLEELLGCKVDIVSDNGLRERIKDRVLREAVQL